MRKKRVVQAGKCYHLVSRVAHRAFFFDDDEKARFVDKDADNPRVRGEEQERAGVGAGDFESALAISDLPESAEGAGLHRADTPQEAHVAVAALQASAQGKGCASMNANTAYTVNHIQKGLALLPMGSVKRKRKLSRQHTFIDLFAGCGGLSEGFYQKGFKALLHLEIDKTACETLKERMRHYQYSESEIERSVLCGDITKTGIISEIDSRVDGDVDVLVGGPPCQAFSSVGRARDPNSMRDDPRNYLFENYIAILNHFKPKMFVFENVKGILTAKPNGGLIFPKILERMRENYDVIDEAKILLLNASNYGVPQNRERVIIIGSRRDLQLDVRAIYQRLKKTNGDGQRPFFTVRDAISDLPKLLPGEGAEKTVNAEKSVNEYLALLNSSKVPNPYVLNHRARNHNAADQERYRILSEHGDWQLKDLQSVRPDLIHHDPRHFGNRYTVQEYDKPGRTIVAHLYKDGNLFIHPDPAQSRTFTVREAARIQSFPDDFFFAGSRTDQYKQVGNAVPPLLARAIAGAVGETLENL